MARVRQVEHHRVGRLGWLRAAVLGANDGLLSTASLIIGVASAATSRSAILIAGVAGLIAGAMSMAAGEYVSVSSQRDSEKADLDRETIELASDPAGEHVELAGIYMRRGLDEALATRVASELMAKNALDAHARDELELSNANSARPLQAALASAASFAIGAMPPVTVAMLAPQAYEVVAIGLISLLALAVLGGVGARIGGAPVPAAVARVVFWGAMAMLVTAGIGRLFGARLS